jgi:hypothetical protein
MRTHTRWTRAGVALLCLGALAAVAAVTARAGSGPANLSPPTISGTAQQGQTLVVSSTGTWSTEIDDYDYQWQRCDGGCSNISGATSSTYLLTATDVGKTVRVVVEATANGSSTDAESAQTAVVTGAAGPSNSSLPTISGNTVEGQALTASNGTWSGTTPISYTHRWRRCDANGSSCSTISGATSNQYTLVQDDVGRRIRVEVTASNAGGSSTATSAATGAIEDAKGPSNTSRPTISGRAEEAQTLTASRGTWSGTETISYAYQWRRCDSKGNSCSSISGATGDKYTATGSDVGRTLRVRVTASNAGGSTNSDSNATGVVRARPVAGPADAIKLGDGRTSIPASSVSLPERLIASAFRYSANPLRSRSPFTMHIRVADTRGFVVRDALVYVIGLPYDWVRRGVEARTGQDGWATIQLEPTANLPLRRGALVMFVRVRKEGERLLAGVSSRRLVQVRIGG